MPVRSLLLSRLRIVVLLFSAVTEKFKVKKLINLLNVKDSQNALADINYEVLKK